MSISGLLSGTEVNVDTYVENEWTANGKVAHGADFGDVLMSVNHPVADGLMVKGQSGIQSNQGFVDFAALKLIPKIVKYVLKACVVTVCLHNCTITIKSVPIKRVT